MLVLYCQTCRTGRTNYRKWINHLFSAEHQKKTKRVVKGWSKTKKRRAVLFTEFRKPNEEVQEEDFKNLAWKASEHTLICDLFFSCSKQMCLILVDAKKGADLTLRTEYTTTTPSDGHQLYLRLASDIPLTEWDGLFINPEKQVEEKQGESDNTPFTEIEKIVKVEACEDENADPVIIDGNQNDFTENIPVATAVTNFGMENNEISDVLHSPNMQNANFNKPMSEKNSESMNTESLTSQNATDLNEMTLSNLAFDCRSIRIGSYKKSEDEVAPFPLRVHFSSNLGLVFSMPHCSNSSTVKICIPVKSVSFVQMCTKRMPSLFIWTTPTHNVWIREQLGMGNEIYSQRPKNEKEWPNENLILMLMKHCQMNVTERLIRIFGKALTRINYEAAHQTLLKTALYYINPFPAHPVVPVNDRKSNQETLQTNDETANSKAESQNKSSSKEMKTLLSIDWNIDLSNRDLESLTDGNCINDKIIEFWLKYMTRNSLSPQDQNRTFIFSPWFYPKLSTKVRNESTRLSVAERRHARVAYWTKNDDIFKYDFLLVPILENSQSSHWILAVICFSSLDGVYDLVTEEFIEGLKTVKTKKPKHGEMNSRLSLHDGKEVERSSNDKKKDFSACGTSSPDCKQNTVPVPPEGKVNANTQKSFGSGCSRNIKRPCILIFGSWGDEAPTKIYSTLREYLRVEYSRVNNGDEKEFNCRTMPGCRPRTPRYTNNSDSGLYVLQCAESLFSDPIKSYMPPLGSELRNWFTSAVVQGKRKQIYDSIVQLIKTENPENFAYVPQLVFHSADSSSTSTAGLSSTMDSKTTSPKTSRVNFMSGNSETKEENLSPGPPASKKIKLEEDSE